jgi:hypothetical protein
MADVEFIRFQYRIGKSKKAKVYNGFVGARLLRKLNRYSFNSTVGFGGNTRFLYTDQPGTSCQIAGFWTDGRLSVCVGSGGCFTLTKADVEAVTWPDYATPEQRQKYDAAPVLPPMIQDNGEHAEQRHFQNDKMLPKGEMLPNGPTI